MRSGPARIEGLDVLRGCAAAAVMLHHHGQYYDVLFPGRRALSFNLGPGHFGVELFFIISGFVILMTIERKKTVLDFAVSRFTRLMPAFLAALLMASVILTLAPMPPMYAPTVPQLLANLTMAPSLFSETGVDLPYWTLTYELVFYVYMAIALWLGVLRSLDGFGLLLMAIGYLFLLTGDVEHHRRTSILLLVHYSSFFLIGICLYRVRTLTARPLTYGTLACAVAATGFGGGETSFWTPGSLYLPLTASFTALVWFATGPHGRWIAWRPLVFLGRISYPLYLVHAALGFSVIRIGIERGWSTLAGVVAAGAASLIAATALHYLVEEPAERRLRVFFRRWTARAVPLPDTAE